MSDEDRKGRRPRKMGRPTTEAALRLTSHILKSARELFFEHGFDGASADMIAEQARISKRTLYARFGSKARVFEAAILNEIDTQLRALEPSGSDEPDIGPRLRVIADRLLEWGPIAVDQDCQPRQLVPPVPHRGRASQGLGAGERREDLA